MLVSGIYGAEWVLMEVVLLWRFGLAVAWGVVFCVKYVIVVDVDVRVVVVSRLGWWMVVCVEGCCVWVCGMVCDGCGWKDVGMVGMQ